jgi:hypothetical protein
VCWHRTGGDAAAIMTIIWHERGGPPIEAPVRSSYGNGLIRDLIPHELGGAVDLTFPSDGACCKFEIRLESGAKIPRDSVRKFFNKLRVTAHREMRFATPMRRGN